VDRLERLAQADPRVRVVRGERRRGLARAVVDGFAAATGEAIAVLDGDLQHPPSLLPYLVRVLQDEGADLVVPSRYIEGGSPGGLSFARRVVSLGARLIAQLVLKEARRTTDPLGGFFVVRRAAVEGVDLRPRGWKILLEILVRGRVERVVDVPYTFEPRRDGDSKLGLGVQLEFLRHVVELFVASRESRRFWLFALVGALGVAVNALAFALFLHLGDEDAHLWLVASSLLASQVAMFHNFLWNYWLTWADRRQHSFAAHLFRYWVVSELGSAVTALVALVLAPLTHSPEAAQLTGVVIAVAITYQLTNRWVFGARELERGWQAAR
jgi:dolichol-phosphate mannosyltransferase